MSIEDILSLNTLLSADIQLEDIPGRLKLYERYESRDSAELET